MASEKEYLYQLLNDIKEDLKTMDEKWEKMIEESSEHNFTMKYLTNQVDRLNKYIVEGNGQESVLVRLSKVIDKTDEIVKDIGILSHRVEEISKHNKLKEELKVSYNNVKSSKWAAVAKIAGLLAIAIPGIVALLK